MQKKTLFTVSLVEEESGDITVNSEQDLDGADLDFLIQRLAIARMQLQPPVPEEPQIETGVEPHVEPFLKWAAGSTPEHGPVLAIRHSGLGWVWLRPSPGFATALQTALNETPHQKPTAH